MIKVLESRFSLIFLIPFLLGLISVFGFQPFNFSIVNFIIFPALFFIFTYVNKKSKSIYRKKPHLKYLFLIGYFFGVGFFLSGTYWITNALTFDPSFQKLIPFVFALIPLTLGIFFGLMSIIFAGHLRNNFGSVLLFSLMLSVNDFFRSKVLTGFPWNLWAYSLSWFDEFLQILNPIGLFSFNLIVITLFSIPAVFFFNNKKNSVFTLLFSIIIAISIYFYGSYKVNTNQISINKSDNEKSINFKIVSPSFNIQYNLDDEQVQSQLKDLIKYSDPDKSKKTIFVWPEGVFAGYSFFELKKFKNSIDQNFSEKHIIIFGVNTLDQKSGNFFNSLVAINNKFEILYTYNKKKLVPFGEFIPFEDKLKLFGLKKVTEGFGSFLRGRDQKNFIFENYNILPLICYEIIFTDFVQKSDHKTNLIINLSEDGWFGKSIGPYQHLSKAKFRAIENNTFVIRTANRGFSAFINNRGEIIKSLNPSESGNIEMKVPVLTNNNKNKNDLIFLILLITYTSTFLIFRNE